MITSFGISLAAGIVIELYKSIFPVDINQEIEEAFDEAIKKCVKNDDITKRSYKSELKRIIRENYNQNPNTNLKDDSITGLHAKFFIEFEQALVKRKNAYSYIKEIRDDSRFQELKDGQEGIRKVVGKIIENQEELKQEVVGEIKEGLEDNKIDADKIKEKQEELKQEVGKIRESQEGTKKVADKIIDNQEELKQGVGEIKEGIEDNKKDTDGIKENQKELKQGIEEAKEQLADLITQSDNSKALKSEYLRQLNQYQKNLEGFNPSIALENLLALEESFAKNGFVPDDILKSNVELLKARCYSLLPEKSDNTLTSYIKAYNLNNNSDEARVLASYAYFETENELKAEELVKEILLTDEYNPIASAIKAVLMDSDSLVEILDSIQPIIRKNAIFKRFIFSLSIKRKKYIDLDNAFEKYNILLDISHFNNTNLTYQNYKERLFLVESIIQRFNKNTYINFLKEENVNRAVEFYYNILDNFLNGVKNSELDNFHVVKFYHTYFDYLINGNKDSVYLMKDLYKQIENKTEPYMLFTANSLQTEGDFDGAINILQESGNKSETALFLEMFCWSNKKKFDEYVKTTKQFLNSVKQISINDSERLFRIIEYLKIILKLKEFKVEDFIKDKQFEIGSLKMLLTEYINIYKEEYNDETIGNLKEITQEILLLSETRIKYRLARLLYILQYFKEAVNVFENFIETEKESEELHYYIQALYYGNLKQKKLILLLAKWRNDFSSNLILLKIEINLNFILYNYDIIVEICQKYIEIKKDDELILTNYAIALYNSDNDYINEFIYYLELIKDFDFLNPNNAQTIAGILSRKSFHNEAFLIYYNSALKFPETKSNYFLINIPKELDEKYEVVQEGLFIQYETEEKLLTIEVTNDSSSTSQLIGKRINDKIEIDNKIGNHKQSIIIKRILNKYQALKLQIIDEVNDNNPLSEIPMQSFNFKNHLDSGGNILDFIIDIVGENNYEDDKKVDIEKYHRGEVSYTEIVTSYYSLNFVKAFYDLKYEQNGLFQIHPIQYPYIDFNYYDYFILDFTSLLFLYELSKNNNAIFNRKFVLPTSTKTIIRHYQSERFIYKGKNYLLDKEFHKGLLEWIDYNCVYRMSVLKLDVVSKMPNTNKPNIVNDYFIDIGCLMLEFEKSLLITDDVFYTKIFPLESRRIIGSGLYIIKSIIEQ